MANCNREHGEFHTRIHPQHAYGVWMSVDFCGQHVPADGRRRNDAFLDPHRELEDRSLSFPIPASFSFPFRSGARKGIAMTSVAGNVQSAAATALLRRAPERPPGSGENRALIAVLSPAKRAALVACLVADGLNKRSGAWHGIAGGKPISGVTVADLARDGLLSLSRATIGSALRV